MSEERNLVTSSVFLKSKDKKWLSTRLKKMGYDDVTSLLLVTCNTNEELTVYEKNVKELKKGCLE